VTASLANNWETQYDEAKAEFSAGNWPFWAGLDAGKPAAGIAGRVYVATDTRIIYRDSGTAWVKVGVVDWGNIDGKPSTFPPSAHKTTHASDGSDVLTPADIGAVDKAGDTMTGDLTVERAGTPVLTVQTTAAQSQDAILVIKGARATSTTGDIAQLHLCDGSNAEYEPLAKITARKQASNTQQGNLLFMVNDGSGTFNTVLKIDKDGNLYAINDKKILTHTIKREVDGSMVFKSSELFSDNTETSMTSISTVEFTEVKTVSVNVDSVNWLQIDFEVYSNYPGDFYFAIKYGVDILYQDTSPSSIGETIYTWYSRYVNVAEVTGTIQLKICIKTTGGGYQAKIRGTNGHGNEYEEVK